MRFKARILIAQFVKFAGVGIISFLLDYSLLIIFTELFEFHYLVSTTMSFTASIIFNYLVSMRFVFTHRSDISRGHEFIIFMILSAIGLFFNNIGMFIGVSLLHIDYRITKILATMCVTLFNFFTRRMFLDGMAHEKRQKKKMDAAGRYIYVNEIAPDHKLAQGAAAAERLFFEYASTHSMNGLPSADFPGSASNARSRIEPAAKPKANNSIFISGVPLPMVSQQEKSVSDESKQPAEEPCVDDLSKKAVQSDQDGNGGSQSDSTADGVFSFDIDYDSTSDYSFGKAKPPSDPESSSLFDY